MLANQKLYAGATAGLPDDQWAREINHWFATQLIAIQSYTTQFVTGWQDEWLNQYLTPPVQSNTWMCNSQIIQRKDYASFSVLATGIILAIGGSLVLLNLGITWLVSHVPSQTPLRLYKAESWKAYDLLELNNAVAHAVRRRASTSNKNDAGRFYPSEATKKSLPSAKTEPASPQMKEDA